ncbi:MAG TPA: hypothetical protein VHN99_02240 [Deinococcales bacterium]|nr:hypothetical protein [Deinococcales bacterium]
MRDLLHVALHTASGLDVLPGDMARLVWNDGCLYFIQKGKAPGVEDSVFIGECTYQQANEIADSVMREAGQLAALAASLKNCETLLLMVPFGFARKVGDGINALMDARDAANELRKAADDA